jgi:arsenate reductase
MIIIYHKPNCSTSLQALALLKKNTKEEIRVVEYLKEVPTQKELKDLVKLLGIKTEQLVRKKEPMFKEQYEGKKISSAEWLRILTRNPILIERPIVVKGNKAILGRPPELILTLFENSKHL